MATLTVTKEQLRLIQTALDFYSRVGTGQFSEIKNHPTFEKHLYKELDCSNDFTKYHSVRDQVDEVLTQAKRLLYNDPFAVRNGEWGIHHPKVDDSCRDAYDLIQVIRHEFWKNNPIRSNITVDSSITLTNENNKNIKVEL
jgi:hypothetical protein